MELKELKAPYEQLMPVDAIELNLNDVADEYLVSSDPHRRDQLFSTLVCRTWVALETIYFQNKNNVSVEDCYDAYLDAIQYVLRKQVWHNSDSTLYNDPDAFIKAVRVTAKHRRDNYVVSQFKHKRMANTYAVSMDQLEEDFSEGYFTDKVFIDKQSLIESRVQEVIKSLFTQKKYLDAYILDAIIFNDVFATVNYITSFSYKKMRKCLRHLNCERFAEAYNVSEAEVRYSLKYFEKYSNKILDEKIEKCLSSWKNDPIIKQALI